MATKSRFALNLITLLFIGIFASSFAGSLTVANPLGSVLYSVGKLANWSFSIGLLYGFFRLCGVIIDPIEWYYQNVPFGWSKKESATVSVTEKVDPKSTGFSSPDSAPTQNLVAPTSSKVESSQSEGINWEKVFSVNYFRYAGILLIISAVAAFLFRIEWSLSAKIVAALVGAGATLFGAEFSRSKNQPVLAAASFLISFALFQFAATLSCKYFALPLPAAEATIWTWLIIKLLVLVGALGLLSRYPASFVLPSIIVIGYFTPVTLTHILVSIPLVPFIAFILSMTAVTLVVANRYNRPELRWINALAANSYLIYFFLGQNGFVPAVLRNFGLSATLTSMNSSRETFVALAVVLVLQLAAQVAANVRNKAGTLSMALPELLAAPTLGLICLLDVQQAVPEIAGYYGITLLVASLLQFFAFFYERSAGVPASHSATLLNFALVVAATGLFVETRGAWTAVVFLLFSCAAVYVSFVLGTVRTRIYSCLILTASMVKLYLECSELFDSISGTTVILIIGMILIFLSYWVERLKKKTSLSSTESV